MNKMKLLLINPIWEAQNKNIVHYSHGLLSIVSYLRSKGIPLKYIDLDILDISYKDINHIKDIVCKVYNENEILFTGISSLITNYRSVQSIIAVIRDIAPDQLIIVGGSLGATLPQSLRDDIGADILVDKDGEYVCEHIYKILLRNRSYSTSKLINDISGLPRWFDVSNADIPAYDILDMKTYIKKNTENNRMFSVISGRGCSMGCNFCFRMSGNRIRKKKVKTFIAELCYLKQTFGIKAFNFDDDNFAMNPRWIDEFLNELSKNDLGIQWRFQSSLQTLGNFKLIEKMQRVGMVGVSIGLESGSERMLLRMNKAIPIKKAPAILSQLKSLGLTINSAFIIGYPGETEGSLLETLEFINRNCNHGRFQVFFYQPYPKTAGYEYCMQKGIINDEKEYILNLKHQNTLYINCSQLKDETLFKYRELMFSGGI